MNVIACVSSCAVDVTVYHDGYHGDLKETVGKAEIGFSNNTELQ